MPIKYSWIALKSDFWLCNGQFRYDYMKPIKGLDLEYIDRHEQLHFKLWLYAIKTFGESK